jgi:hypothetical protein
MQREVGGPPQRDLLSPDTNKWGPTLLLAISAALFAGSILVMALADSVCR